MRDDKRIGPLLPSQTSAVVLQHLRYAVSAAEHGSFRRAAEALRLRQSTLSRRIRQLEESIGLIVFDRSSGGVRATTAGRDFLRATRSILEQIDTLVTAAHSTGRGEAGRLKIGFCTSLSAGNLRATLLDFRARFPQVELGMVERSRTRLVTALRNGGLDLAIVTGETALLDGRVVPLWSERIFVVLPEGHPLTARDIIYWTDLRNETVLLSDGDPGPELEDLLMAKLISPGERPTITRHEISRGNLRSLVGAGFGISLMTEASIGTTLGGVIYREVRDGMGPARAGYSAHWRGDNRNPALASFLKLLSERYPLPGAGA